MTNMQKTWRIGFVTSVVFWVMVIFAFLYLPYAYEYFISPRSVNIYTWADMFDPEALVEFEDKTGIKVNLSYYDNNEEMLTKIKITKGRGYDLLVVTDYGIPDLTRLKIAKKINKKKLDFWNELDSRVLGNYYDPNNNYTIPFCWDIYGIGINIDKFGKMPKSSWSLLFDDKVALPKIGMVDDGFESVCIAAQYLYGDYKTLSDAQLYEIKQLLINQKKLVEAYTDLRGDYLLMSETSPTIVSQAAHIRRAMQEDDRVKILVPQEGSFKIFDSMVMTKSSTKDDMVYEFINFFFQKQVMKEFIEEMAFLPVRKDLLQEVDLDYLGGVKDLMDPKKFNKYAFFKRNVSMDKINRLWIEVKAS